MPQIKPPKKNPLCGHSTPCYDHTPNGHCKTCFRCAAFDERPIEAKGTAMGVVGPIGTSGYITGKQNDAQSTGHLNDKFKEAYRSTTLTPLPKFKEAYEPIDFDTQSTEILQDRLKYTEKRLKYWQLMVGGAALINIIILFKVFL